MTMLANKTTIIIKGKGKFFPSFDPNPDHLIILGLIIILAVLLFIYKTNNFSLLRDFLDLATGNAKKILR